MMTSVRKWVIGGVTAVLALTGSAYGLNAAQSSGAAVTADCGQPSYDGVTFSITCTVPQATTTVTQAGPTVTATPTATTTSTAPTSSASSTPTPTPTVVPAGYPNASTTGVPAGTVLTKRGGFKVTASNSTYQNLEIDGCVTFGSGVSNVVFRNVLFKSDGCYWLLLNDVGATGIQVFDSEFDSLNNPNADAAVNGSNITLTRVNIHGSVDGIKAGSNMVVQDSYIHDLVVTSSSHNDGIQSLGTTKLTITHNSILLGDGVNAAIILSTGSADAMKNVLADNNLLSGGGYTVFGGYEAGVDVRSRVSNIVFSNNKFKIAYQVDSHGNPDSGFYGPFTSVDSPVVLTNNTWFDGPNAGKTVS